MSPGARRARESTRPRHPLARKARAAAPAKCCTLRSVRLPQRIPGERRGCAPGHVAGRSTPRARPPILRIGYGPALSRCASRISNRACSACPPAAESPEIFRLLCCATCFASRARFAPWPSRRPRPGAMMALIPDCIPFGAAVQAGRPERSADPLVLIRQGRRPAGFSDNSHRQEACRSRSGRRFFNVLVG